MSESVIKVTASCRPPALATAVVRSGKRLDSATIKQCIWSTRGTRAACKIQHGQMNQDFLQSLAFDQRDVCASGRKLSMIRMTTALVSTGSFARRW
jgi:hypothetical protein